MKLSHRGLDLIKQFEGVRYEAYQDVAGIWTIGYGHTAGVKQGDTCDATTADAWLQADTAFAVDAVNRLVTQPVSQNQFDALVDFTFNCGVGAFERSTLLRRLNAGDYDSAADEFPRWSFAAGVHVKGLLRRREAERNLFLSKDAA